MQTRKFGFRSLALLSVLALGLAACDDTNVVGTPTNTTISISPSGTVELEVGDRITVVASVQNPPSGATTTFSSSNTAVATVDASGVVTAVSPGIATISASTPATQGGTASAALAVRVVAEDGGEPVEPSDSAAINITSIVDAGGDAVDLTNVEGTIFVRIDYTRPTGADSVRVRLIDADGAEAGDQYCVQAFNTAAAKVAAAGLNLAVAQVEFVCPFNTARVGEDGTVTFSNGDATVVAELFDGADVVARATRNLTLDNENTFALELTTTQDEIGEDGLLWQNGDVTVTARPAIFDGVTEIASVTFNPSVGETIVDDDPSDGFSATFAEDDELADADEDFDVTDETFTVTITSITEAGEEGPGDDFVIETDDIRYDNDAPDETDVELVGQDFIGAEFEFSSTVDQDSDGDDIDASDGPGVGNEVVRFFVVDDFTDFDAGERDLDVIADIMGGDEVTGGADFDEGEEADVVALLCDALDNCVVVGGFDFTADLTAPTIEDISVEDSTIYNVGDDVTGEIIDVTVEDDVSGFENLGLLVSATRLFLDGDDEETVCVIGDEVTQANFEEAFTEGEDFADFNGDGEVGGADSTCEAVEIESAIPVPDAAGYYTFNIQTIDAAGNVSEDAEVVRILVDQAAPVVDDVDFDATLEGGVEEEFEADLTDNLDLNSFIVLVNYTDLGELPITSFVTIDNTFGSPLTGEAAASTTAFFVPAIEIDDDNTDGITIIDDVTADEVTIRATDQANNIFGATDAIAQVFAESDFGGDMTGYDVEAVDDELPADGSATATVRAQVIVPEATTDNPADRVFFYARTDAGGGDFNFALIGVDETASQSVTTTERIFTYTAELSLAQAASIRADEDGETVDIVGVAVDEDGNGIAEIETAAVTIVED